MKNEEGGARERERERERQVRMGQGGQEEEGRQAGQDLRIEEFQRGNGSKDFSNSNENKLRNLCNSNSAGDEKRCGEMRRQDKRRGRGRTCQKMLMLDI
jgi:hypothetical protein